MEEIELKAEERTTLGKKVRRIREDGWVPAILYGARSGTVALQIETRHAEAIVSQAGTSQLIQLHVGKKKPVQALVRDLQRDPIRRQLLHIDLYQVDMAQRINVEVPLVLVGQSPVVERHEGILLQGQQTIEIECLPGDLIEAIEVDLTDLVEVDEQINVSDLAIPSSIEVLSDLDEMVVRINPLEEIPEEEEEVVEELLAAEPELIGEEGEEQAEEEQSGQ